MTHEKRAEIPYWWRVTTQNWVVLLVGWIKFPTRHDQSEAPTQAWVVLTNLGACKPTFYTFFTSQYYEELFLSYRPRTECSISHCTYSIFWPERSKHEWAFCETAKKFSKSPVRPAGCDLWSVWMNINRVTLQHNKEFIMFPFYWVVL